MDFRKLNEFLRNRWFQVLILLGIFVLLYRPTTNIKDSSISNKQNSNNSIFRDISVSPQVGSETPMNTVSISENKKEVTLVPKGKDPIALREKREDNKKIVIDECLRRQPLLGENHQWGIFEHNDYPSINFMIKKMESKYGMEFYDDVDEAVSLIMKSIGDE